MVPCKEIVVSFLWMDFKLVVLHVRNQCDQDWPHNWDGNISSKELVLPAPRGRVQQHGRCLCSAAARKFLLWGPVSAQPWPLNAEFGNILQLCYMGCAQPTPRCSCSRPGEQDATPAVR